MDPVREQYERYPYPDVKWLGTVKPEGVMHASFETGASLCLGRKLTHENKQILLLGAGTMEPYAMSSIHPLAKITAVDLSNASIARAKVKALLHGRLPKFIRADLLEFAERESRQFDYIHCFGVLHHLKEPELGFAGLKKLLAPKGFARVMVYSQAARKPFLELRSLLRGLNINIQDRHAPKVIKALISSLPSDNPLRQAFEKNEDTKFAAGIIDSVFHAEENPFTLQELLAVVERHDLKIAAWDFSQNLLELLDKESGSLLERIQTLQDHDKWQAPFTFWLVHKELDPVSPSSVFLNPVWFRKRGEFWSPLLKRHIHVDLDAPTLEQNLFHARVLLRGE